MRRVVIVSAFLLPCIVQAQTPPAATDTTKSERNGKAKHTPAVKYSWQQQSLEQDRALRSGEVVRFVLEDLNRLCFDYAVTIEQKTTTSVAAAFIPFLSGGGTTPVDATKAPPAKDTMAAGVVPMTVDPAPATPSPESAARNVDAARNKAVDALTAAREAVDGLTKTQQQAIEARETFLWSACPGGSARGLSNKALQESGFLKTESTKTKDVADGTPAAKGLLATATERRDSALKVFTDFQRRLDTDAAYIAWYRLSANQQWVRETNAFLDATARDVKKLTESSASLAATQVALASSRQSIDAALKPDSIVRTVHLNRDTERMDVVIKATGRADIARLKGTVIEDKLAIAVTVAHRISLSAGMLFTALRERSYQRTSVLGADGAAYSTFLDTKDDRSFAFAPTVLSSISLLDAGSVSFAFTGGVAVRTVRDKAAPEFVLGPSVSVRDQVFLTVGMHFGREETLLIGHPDSVRTRAVPDDITRAGAVGDKWKSALAVVLSYRMP